MPLEVGDLVDSPYGIGKLIRINNNDALIKYFDSPVNYEGIEQTVEVKHLKKAELHAESLVYRYDYEVAHWQIARVVGAVPGGVRLHFPNKQQEDVSLNDIFVRWDRPISDAAALLAERITYTPFWQDARLAYQHQMLKQRNACAGITSSLSSSIELEPYQLAVARRVLSDPIQRYLLADEVGLGKTIEAGLIVRQHVTENPLTHCVVIVAPGVLHRQWQQELSARFHLEELLNKSIHIIDMAAFSTADPLSFRPDMLVIDEAHQVGAWAWDAEYEQRYASVNYLAQQSEKLLLLSATPVTGNEKNFLAMLHLLDAKNYPLTDTGLQKFQQRIQQREEIGSLFYAFNCDNDNMTLEENLEALTRMFPEDEVLNGMASQLLPHLDMMQPLRSEARDLLINKIRHYIGNRYRLHHRLLRNRRSNPAISVLMPGLSGLSLKKYATTNASNDMMIAWRESAIMMHPQDPTLAAIYQLLFEAAIATPELLARLANYRLQQESLGAAQGFLYSDSQLALLQHPLFDGEKEILLELIDRCKMECDSKRQRLIDVLEKLLDSNVRELPYIVVFCYQPWVADQVFTDLMIPFIGKIQRHNPDKEVRFGKGSKCQILVCDRRAEEGVNLHGGRKIALHYDLLLSPNRMEQRLGRLNRYCATESATTILSMALVSEAEGLQNQWLTILNEVFNVFEESIASLQYLIDEELQRLISNLYPLGEESMMQLSARLAGEDGRLTVEKQRIEMQEVLLQIDGDIIEAREYADALADIDENEEEFRRCARNLIGNVLKFDFIPDEKDPSIFRYRFNPGDRGTGTLVSPQRLQKHCLLGFDLNQSSGSSPMTWPLSYYRADTSQGKIRPARLGEPFHDAILQMLDFEERGVASAIIRITPGIGDENIFFRYDFLIEADVNTPALQRLADHLMPPETITLWLDQAGEQVTNAEVLMILNEDYKPKDKGGRHLNLNEERWAQISHCISAKDWRTWCNDSYSIAQRLAVEQFATQQALSLSRLEHYLSSAALHHANRQETGQMLRQGIAQPKMTCLATRALIIASEAILDEDS